MKWYFSLEIYINEYEYIFFKIEYSVKRVIEWKECYFMKSQERLEQFTQRIKTSKALNAGPDYEKH